MKFIMTPFPGRGRGPVRGAKAAAVITLGTVLLGAAGCSDPYVSRSLGGIELTSGDMQVGIAGGPLPEPLIVSAFDQFAEPIAGARIQFDAEQGAFDAPVRMSGLDGTARVVYTLGPTPGAVTITASSWGGEMSVEFTAFAELGDPAFFRISSGNNQTGEVGTPLELPLRVRVTNQYNVGIPDAVVTWDNQGRGSLSDVRTTTDELGYAEVVLTLDAEATPHTVTAMYDGFFPVTFTALAQ